MTKTYAKILESGAKLIAKNGFEQTTTAKIAKAASVSEPTVFRHFPTKEDLLLAIFKHTRLQTNEIARNLSQAPPADALINIFTALSRFLLSESPDFGKVSLIEGRRASARSRPLLPESDEFNQIIERIFQRGQEDGVFRAELNVQAVRQAIIGASEDMVLGWIWQKQSRGKFRATYTEEEAIEVLRCLVEGMKLRPEFKVDDAKKLLLFELRLEAKRYELCQHNCEDEHQWQQTLKTHSADTAEELLAVYREYKFSLFKQMFGEEKEF